MDSVANVTCSKKSLLNDSVVGCYCFFLRLRTAFPICVALETALEIECSFKVSLGILDGSIK